MNTPLLDTIIGAFSGAFITILIVIIIGHFMNDTPYVEVVEYDCIDEVCTLDVHGSTVYIREAELKHYKKQLKYDCQIDGHYVVVKEKVR